MKEFKKLEILIDICKFYGYEINIKENGTFSFNNGMKEHAFESPSLDRALIDWLPTLEESTEGYDEDSKDTWKEEIQFIRNLKINSMSNVELGREIVEIYRGIEFYEFVKWNEIEDVKYIELVDILRKDEKTFNKIKNYIKNKDELFATEYLDEEYDNIQANVDKMLLKRDYYFTDEDNRFYLLPTIDSMIEFLKSHKLNAKNDGERTLKVDLGFSNLIISLDDTEYFYAIPLDDYLYRTDSLLNLLEFINEYKNELGLKDKAYNIVENWLNSYSYKILDKKTLWELEFLHVEDLEQELENTDKTLGHWCDFFIEEIDHKLSDDTDEKVVLEWTKEKNIMQQYLDNENETKENNCDLEYKAYEIVATNISHRNIELLQILVDNDIYLRTYDYKDESENITALSYWCKDVIGEIDYQLEYGEKDMKETFIEEKKILQQYLNENKYEKLLEKVCEFYGCGLEKHENGLVSLEDFIDKELISIEDALILFYKDFLKNDWNNKDDLKLIEELLNKGEISLNECEKTVNNSLQVKYDICLKYERKINCCMHHITFTTGIPFVTKDSELLIATGVLGRTYNDKFAIDEIYCNKEVICISKLKYWLGLSHENLFEQIDVLVKENDIKEYIELKCGTKLPITSIEDVLKIKSDMDDEIKDYHIEDESLRELLKIHKGNSLSLFLADVDELFRFVKHNKKAFDKLIELDSDCNNWLNDEIFYYDMDRDLAIECFLEEECHIPSNAIRYMEIDKYIKNELDIKIIEGEDFTIIDSY